MSEQQQPDWETDPSRMKWDALERDVVTRIRVLRASVEAIPEPLRAKMMADLVGPVLHKLGEFCACVELEDDTKGLKR